MVVKRPQATKCRRSSPIPELKRRKIKNVRPKQIRKSATTRPQIIIFDVDGVLVDVQGSYLGTVLETVKHFTGKRVTMGELHRWKNQSGYNDDWKLSTAWVQSLGGKAEYDEIKAQFVKFYWGANGKPGNVAREKWLVPRTVLRRLARAAELGIFTGRVRQELDYTFDRNKTHEYFRTVVTADDVAKHKPDPEGLFAILKGRDPQTALYVGDNVDDAKAARAAGIPFAGLLPRGTQEWRERAPILRELGATRIFGSVSELEAFLRKTHPQIS